MWLNVFDALCPRKYITAIQVSERFKGSGGKGWKCRWCKAVTAPPFILHGIYFREELPYDDGTKLFYKSYSLDLYLSLVFTSFIFYKGSRCSTTLFDPYLLNTPLNAW
jgi:hypothetical protein